MRQRRHAGRVLTRVRHPDGRGDASLTSQAIGWKIGFQVCRDAPVADTGADGGAAGDAASESEAPDRAGTASTRSADYSATLYVHARIEVADRIHGLPSARQFWRRPGGGSCLGLGASSAPTSCGRYDVRLGHNCWRRHGGNSNTPTASLAGARATPPETPRATRRCRRAHLDYSREVEMPLDETFLFDSTLWRRMRGQTAPVVPGSWRLSSA